MTGHDNGMIPLALDGSRDAPSNATAPDRKGEPIYAPMSTFSATSRTYSGRGARRRQVDACRAVFGDDRMGLTKRCSANTPREGNAAPDWQQN